MNSSFALVAAILGFASSAEPLAQAKAEHPNIVLINADDLGYGDLGCYGATMVRTPNIDSLARDGRLFTDAHSASAVCSPSRYGLLTGRYPLRKNYWGPTGIRFGLCLDPNRDTLARILQQQGYATACFGKWHLGFGEETPDWNGRLAPGPLEIGFDTYFGLPCVNSGPPFVWVEDHHVLGLDPLDPFVYGEKSVTREYPEKMGYKTIGGAQAAHRLYEDELVGTELRRRSIEWIDQQTEARPFFLYLATTNIHHPFTPAKPFVGTSDCGAYGDFIHELDWIVGGVLEAVDGNGFGDNTLIIFTSDNGGMLNVTGQKAWQSGHRLNGDLLGFKFGAWEGGHRVPFIARWPGRIPTGSESHHLICQIDLLATFAKIVGQPLKGEHDSIDQLETLTGSPKTPARETLILAPNSPKHLAVRHGRWVFIPEQGAGGFQGKKAGDHLLAGIPALGFVEREHSDIVDGTLIEGAPPAQLYDLVNDPTQERNVFRDHPDIVEKMREILNRYRAEIPSTPRLGWINLKQ